MVEPINLAEHVSADENRKRIYAPSEDNSTSASPSIDHGTENVASNGAEQMDAAATTISSPSQRPARPEKRVRFSDPGPRATPPPSTQLTPAMRRASLNDRQFNDHLQTPTRRQSRRFHPSVGRLADPINGSNGETLDARTRRRLWRSRIREEIGKKEEGLKDLKKAQRQIERLSKELETYRSSSLSSQSDYNDDPFENVSLDNEDRMDYSILMSDSPMFPRHNDTPPGLDSEYSSPDEISPITPYTTSSAHQFSVVSEGELQSISEDLAAVRKERQDLFKQWRKLSGSAQGSEQVDSEDAEVPSDFSQRLLSSLQAALKKESDLSKALEAAVLELEKMGFSGVGVVEKISQMRDAIHSARVDLDRLVPGEALGETSDVKSILQSAIKHLGKMSSALSEERRHVESLTASNHAVEKKLDDNLVLLDQERERMSHFSNQSAADVLHIRMRMQELEQEVNDKEVAVTRFRNSLRLKEEECKDMEVFISELERQIGESQRERDRVVNSLTRSLDNMTGAAERRLHEVEKVKQSLSAKQAEIDGLLQKVKELMDENKEHLNTIHQNGQVISGLNNGIINFKTKLRKARDQMDRIREYNAILDAQYRQQIATRRRLETWFNNTMQAAKDIFAFERQQEEDHQRMRQDFVDGVLSAEKIDEITSEPTLPPIPPYLIPTTASAVTIRVGRGKDTRTISSEALGFDSALGPSESTNLLSEAHLRSDDFLRAVDGENEEVEVVAEADDTDYSEPSEYAEALEGEEIEGNPQSLEDAEMEDEDDEEVDGNAEVEMDETIQMEAQLESDEEHSEEQSIE